MMISNWQIGLFIIIFILLLIVFFKLGKKIGTIVTHNYWQKQLPSLRKEIANSSRSIIKGQVTEQFAPFLPNFPFNPAECKFLGNPIDFLVFQDLENKNESAVIFVEVKSGQSQLTSRERNLKQAVENKNVYWYEYRL